MGNAYDNASLAVTPNAYKTSKIYSLKPDDGWGDLTFSRAGSKMVRNSAVLWETIAANIPPLHYPVGGGCPSWLFEAEATNLIPNSGVFIGGMVTTTITDSPIVGINSVRITKDSASTQYAATTYTATIANSTAYTSSLYFKYDGHDIDSSLEFNSGNDWGLGWKANVEIRSTGITIVLQQNCTAVLVAETNGWYRLEISFTTATVTSNSGSILIKGAGANGASFLVNTCNLTQSAVASSPIVTSGGTLTRFADAASKTGISALIGQTEGTLFIDCIGTYDRSASSKVLATLLGGALNIRLQTYSTGFNLLALGIDVSTPFTSGQRYKLAVVYNGTILKWFINGTLINSYTVTPSTFNELKLGNIAATNQANTTIKDCILYKTALSDSEAIALTTL